MYFVSFCIMLLLNIYSFRYEQALARGVRIIPLVPLEEDREDLDLERPVGCTTPELVHAFMTISD